ncbi:redoxin domain-containing protein [Mucilaginibacter sp. CSA2-8R]|uniref:redoxin domain-containing protein n=1 Tax=Mucilaginibacter sp. CSA2-8R TaxID=3141542 RepID=UPI00315D92B7
MKKLILLFLTCFTLQGYAQIKPGDLVPDFMLPVVLNAPVKTTSLSQLKGKVVLVDFWATWCGSCLTAMPQLSKLQEQYKGKLQVLAVTDESVKRTKQFIASRPSNLWFGIDTGRSLATYFPHHIIPHTVLISPAGKLIANTSPEMVTNAVIDSVLEGEEVHLPVKKDFMYTSLDDVLKNKFPVADTVKSYFTMDDALPGGPSLSTIYTFHPVWKGRRLSVINCSLATIYSLAYGNIPYSRTIDSIKLRQSKQLYCLDIIVAQPGELLPTLQRELNIRFDLHAKMVRRQREVYVLRVDDPQKFAQLKTNEPGKRTYFAKHGAIDQQAITMSDFADYLESYGINKLVIDHTGSTNKYDIKSHFNPKILRV